MLITNLHYVGAFFNTYLLDEACLHDDANAKEALNQVLWKTTNNLTTYAFVLKYFVVFVKSQGPFSNTPHEGPRFVPTWVLGFDWS